MAKPLVSVIIPTYNRAYIIEHAIRSVLEQTFQNFEVVIVDDGSTDNTENIISAINDSRLKYIRHETNMGGGAARNTGIAVACSEYIAFLDSDAVWMPTKLARQVAVALAALPEIVLVYVGGFIEGTYKTYIPSERFNPREGDIHANLFRENFVDTSSLLIKKECFDRAGVFDPNLRMCQDWDLCLRLSKHFKFVLIDEPLYISYIQDNSISRNSCSMISALQAMSEKYSEEIDSNQKLSAHFSNLLGMSYCQNNQSRIGRKFIVQAITKDKLTFKYWLSYLLTYISCEKYLQLFQYLRNKKD